MSDRIVVMNNGKVEQDGTLEELYLQPSSRFVAEFIGDTNLLTGIYRGIDNNDALIDWCGHQIRAQAGSVQPAPGSEVVSSLRLEKIVCQASRPQTDNALPAKIISKVFKGSRISMIVAVDDAQSTRLCTYTDTDANLGNEGDSIWLGWDSKHLALLHR